MKIYSERMKNYTLKISTLSIIHSTVCSIFSQTESIERNKINIYLSYEIKICIVSKLLIHEKL